MLLHAHHSVHPRSLGRLPSQDGVQQRRADTDGIEESASSAACVAELPVSEAISWRYTELGEEEGQCG